MPFELKTTHTFLMPRISIIAAITRNGVIGKNNTLPWHLPADMAFFKRTTTGHTVVMGRKNYQDIGRALPGRRNIVLSRDPNFKAEGCENVVSFEKMLEATKGDDEVFIIGGAAIYNIALEFADRMYLTKIEADIEGDVFFPEVDWNDWTEISRENHAADDRNKYDFSFIEYLRKQ